MNLSIKKFEVQMDLKNKGMELEVRTSKDEHIGDLIVKKKGLTWCSGRTTEKYGTTKSWEEIIEFFNK